MKRALKGTEGFTLLEIIVVLAVVALLAAALTPMILTYLEDAKKAQAQNDVNQIAAAITAFIKDTKVPPYKNSSDMNSPIQVTGDFTCLRSDDGSNPTFTAAGWTALGCDSTTTADLLENQLIKNTPGGAATNVYPTTGRNRWQGPYLPTVKQDPWGNKYVVSIKNAEPKAAIAGGPVVLVLSAGPNNVVDTATDTAKENVIEPGVDDILARVK